MSIKTLFIQYIKPVFSEFSLVPGLAIYSGSCPLVCSNCLFLEPYPPSCSSRSNFYGLYFGCNTGLLSRCGTGADSCPKYSLPPFRPGASQEGATNAGDGLPLCTKYPRLGENPRQCSQSHLQVGQYIHLYNEEGIRIGTCMPTIKRLCISYWSILCL